MAKPKHSLLVVEDDESIRESLQELLESENYTVLLAEHGEEALGIFRKKRRVDMVLLDLSMPVMDGKTFLETFAHEFPDLSETPILIMTAAGRNEVPTYPSGQFLRKPFDVDDLMTRIRTTLKD